MALRTLMSDLSIIERHGKYHCTHLMLTCHCFPKVAMPFLTIHKIKM